MKNIRNYSLIINLLHSINNKLDKIFEIVSFYDKCRWSDTKNYNMINFYKAGLDDDTKLLTHWLCYIMNRQVEFRRVFDIGGFVISELTDKYKLLSNKDGIGELLNSFIQEDKNDSKDKYMLVCTEKPNKKILNDYPDISKDKVVNFKSRFFPSDYYNIRYTLDLLDEYEKSLTYFIAQAYRNNKNDKEHLIQKILFSLHLLTYYYLEKNGQPSYEDIKEQKIDVNKRTKEVKKILDNPVLFEKKFKKFLEGNIYRQKRAWCSLRDFLKSPEYNDYFKNSIKNYLSENEISELLSIEMLRQLELPGDVWNNNPKFQKCILKEKISDKSKFNQFLREYYNSDENNLKTGQTYPEQFDITFDFVPKMCDLNNCDICPIGFLSGEKDKGNNFGKTCVGNTTKYCPVALAGCGYKMMCIGQEECELHKLINSNSHCQNG